MPQYRRPSLGAIAYRAFDARVQAALRDGADPAPPTEHIAATWCAGQWCCIEHAFGPRPAPSRTEEE